MLTQMRSWAYGHATQPVAPCTIVVDVIMHRWVGVLLPIAQHLSIRSPTCPLPAQHVHQRSLDAGALVGGVVPILPQKADGVNGIPASVF
jgi:hypothetical protein